MNFRNIDSMPPSVKAAIERQTGMKSELDEKIEQKYLENIAKEEKKLQRDCENFLRYLEIEFIHLSKDVKKYPGIPDLLLAINGYPLAIEFKSESGRLSEGQKIKLNKMAAHPNGWHVYVIKSYEDFKGLIEKYLKKQRRD